jgi:hypothetical protein
MHYSATRQAERYNDGFGKDGIRPQGKPNATMNCLAAPTLRLAKIG